MKHLVILFLLFCVTLGYGQQYKLWSETVSEAAAGTKDSDAWNLFDDYRNVGKFDGLMVVILDVDSGATKHGDADSLIFYTMYRLLGTWYVGDTISWDRFNTAVITDAVINTDVKAVLPVAMHDSLLVWNSDPTDTSYVAGLPIWDRFKLRVSYSDSSNFTVKARLGRY